MRSDVNVFPVPQAITSRPRSWFASPSTTASTASCCRGNSGRTGRAASSSSMRRSRHSRKSIWETPGWRLSICCCASGPHRHVATTHRWENTGWWSRASLRGSEERVDVALADPVVVVVALALDGDPGVVRAFGNEVDADVPPVEARQLVAIGPVRPAVDLRELELWLLQRDPREELLEPETLLGLVAGFGPDAGQGVADCRLSAEVELGLPLVVRLLQRAPSGCGCAVG